MTARGSRRSRAALAAAAISLIATTACADRCSNTIVAEVPSPSGEMRAVVFERDCGATTGLSAQVSLLRRGERLSNTGGNALAVDSGHTPFLPLEVKPEWVSDRVLRLAYDPRLRTFARETAVAGVTLIHAPTGSR